MSGWRATLAQLVERLIRNQQVASSILAGGSKVLKIHELMNLDFALTCCAEISRS
jgi:hypothetical protein